ncbi:hypothetical protein HNP38_001853 [Chryseobacterium defluvii]|uniref:Uncharacterized protein n=1 Tax=Chryseobacterium defluvii TaxID=160396 RepID=A0A840KF03_9FLAO|nr:hypothetical protein [Chryseobacterium defluvii]MBB4806557.1 hypothetical protein [Chryseobacterium defluvii]
MKFFISIFIIFMIAIRPVLPLVNYVVNYEYIVKNLCENRSRPQSTCNGKCYVEKELAQAEKQSNTPQTIKMIGLDTFLSENILSFTNENFDYLIRTSTPDYFYFYTSEYSSQIFHPPLV